MYTANAVARDYRYEDEMTHSPQKKKKKAKRPVLAQHISTLFVVFLLGMALVVQYTYIQNLGYQISQSKNELKTVQDENEKIKKQIAAMGELISIIPCYRICCIHIVILRNILILFSLAIIRFLMPCTLRRIALRIIHRRIRPLNLPFHIYSFLSNNRILGFKQFFSQPEILHSLLENSTPVPPMTQ